MLDLLAMIKRYMILVVDVDRMFGEVLLIGPLQDCCC